MELNISAEQKKFSLLTWMAANRDPQFLENVIYALKNRKGKQISSVYYLYGGRAKDIGKIKDILNSVVEYFKNQIRIVPLFVGEIDVDNHTAVINSLIKTLSTRLQEMGDICVNISSGTPTITTIWMVLKAMNFFKGKAIYFDAQKYKPSIHKSDDVCPKEEQKIEEINFDINGTYLELIKNIQKINTSGNPLGIIDSKSQARQKAFTKISKFASIDGVPMFLRGERGVGKSNTVEKLIGAIKGKDVISEACGSWDSSLAEAKIFGAEKGSFSGSITKITGLLEKANGKILFLDEIQDLPKNIQRKLLRTIQEKKHPYRSLGDTEEKNTDAEFIFASNFPMDKLRERLDPDFLDRISFYTVTIPSLKECKEDIREDWQKIWESSISTGDSGKRKRQTSIPSIAPWNNQLEEFFSKDVNLQGNLRSLQLVAYQIIAWEAWNNQEQLKEILSEIEAQNIETNLILCQNESKAKINHEAFDISNYPEFTKLSWNDAENHFRAKLAIWLKGKYGSWKKASLVTGISDKTLSKAAKE